MSGEACTTIGCENPGTVTGTFHEEDRDYRVVYCARCASVMGDVFDPDRPAVAEPTEPLHEWACPACGATTRARMADQRPEPTELREQGDSGGAL